MILSHDKAGSRKARRVMSDISGQIYDVACNIIVIHMRYSVNKDTQFSESKLFSIYIYVRMRKYTSFVTAFENTQHVYIY